MPDDDKRKAPERDTTDESLRIERHKTDLELSTALRAVEDDAAEVVAEARDRADALLGDARDREDVSRATGEPSTRTAAAIARERAAEDATLGRERADADAVVDDEGAQRQRALANLLALEREDTDLRLEIERARADEAVTSREDFLAMASHDLRSLLGGIALSADALMTLARTRELDAGVARHVERIQRFSARMNRLIGDLMDIASIEAGKLSIVPARCDARAVVDEALDAYRAVASARGLHLARAPGPDPGVASFDHDRILQVLTNLIGNAVKFTPDGGTIDVRVEPTDDGLRFSVTDTGCGIAGEHLERIFDRFFQTRAHDRRGSGLGLYIARSIVLAHGGTIRAESTPGRGSAFHFTLPRVPSAHVD